MPVARAQTSCGPGPFWECDLSQRVRYCKSLSSRAEAGPGDVKSSPPSLSEFPQIVRIRGSWVEPLPIKLIFNILRMRLRPDLHSSRQRSAETALSTPGAACRFHRTARAPQGLSAGWLQLRPVPSRERTRNATGNPPFFVWNRAWNDPGSILFATPPTSAPTGRRSGLSRRTLKRRRIACPSSRRCP